MNELKTIEVDNCHDCPFMIYDDSHGESACNQNVDETRTYDDFPIDRVHDKCPLKNMNFLIKLK